jgi:NAD(P)-dependent dehydrogenase (short-subunit alcohol dehydrogenase family)
VRLAGKVALVTGAARRRGIGRGIVEALAAEGASVAINDVAAEAEAAELVAELAARGSEACYYPADVTDPAAVEALMVRVEDELGPLYAVCSNAGIARWAPFDEVEEADFDAIVTVNLGGGFNVGRAAARRMLASGTRGRIVFTSSVHAQMPFTGGAIYGGTKQGLRALAETLALELADAGITVNHLAPGWVKSDLGDGAEGLEPEVERSILAQIPAGREARPIEMGKAVAYLCSEDAEYVTGTYLRVDGGLVLGKY